jgi:hypothetical protein
MYYTGVSKKIKNWENRENWTVKKKPIKILKKPTGSVRFGFDFISLKLKKPNWTQTEKTRANRKNRVKPTKPSQTGLNRFLSKKRTESGLFQPVLIFFKFSLVIFFDKKIKSKMITPGIISSNIHTFLTHESLNLDIFNVISLELSYLTTKLHFVGFLK